MKIWFDTEFIEDGRTIDLISIALVREDGKVYYAESSETDWSAASDWVNENVKPHLRGGEAVKSRKTIADEVLAFVGENPEFWAYYADYDWVVLCQLFGRMIDLPNGWPMFCRDLKQLLVERGNPIVPKQTAGAHDALADALWVRHTFDLVRHLPEVSARMGSQFSLAG